MRTASFLTALLTALLTTVAARGAGTFERQVSADPRGVLDISNVSGKVEVSGWDRPEVSVRAELEGGVDRVDVSSDHGHTIIKVVVPAYHWNSAKANLHVQVPRDSELNVSTVSADVSSSKIAGIQRISTVSGSINAEVAQSDVDIKSVSGDVKLRGQGQPTQLRVDTISGDFRLEHGGGEVEATTVSGDLSVDVDSARSVRARTTSGDIRFTGKLINDATVEAQSVSGSLKVRASADGGYDYEAASFSGDIDDCFGVAAERSGKYAPGHRLNGTRSEGRGHVRLKTMSGDIELCDKP